MNFFSLPDLSQFSVVLPATEQQQLSQREAVSGQWPLQWQGFLLLAAKGVPATFVFDSTPPFLQLKV